MSPDVGAVVVHKDCQIADHSDRPLNAVPAQRAPLLVESKLNRSPHGQILSQFAADLLDRHWFPASQFHWPLVPVRQFVSGTQFVEQHEIIEPGLVLATKLFEASAGLAGGMLREVSRRLCNQRHLAVKDGLVSPPVRRGH
jgi:hypothetical protein